MLFKSQNIKAEKESNGSITTTYNFVLNYDRWKAVASGLYLEFLAGIIYAFPVYSGRLKDLLRVTQTELNLCSTLGTVGGNFSILAGIYLDTYGTRLTSHVGALISAFGFLFIYFVTVGTVPGGHISAAIGYLIAYQGLTWMDMSVVTAQVTNFPKDKGLSVGLVKTQFGLASSAIVILSIGLFGGAGKISSAERCISNQYINITTPSGKTSTANSGGLPVLAFFSGLCLVIGTFSSNFLRLTPPTFNNGGKLGAGGLRKMYTIYGCVIFVMVYCLIVSLMNLAWRENGTPPEGVNFIFAIVLIALYAFPYVLTIRTGNNKYKHDNNNSVTPLPSFTNDSEEKNASGNLTVDDGSDDKDKNSTNSNNTLKSTSMNADVETEKSTSRAVKASMYNLGFFEALMMIEFWCLFFTFFGGTGAAYMTINNLPQINYALGGNSVKKSYLVVLIGVFNCIGRIVMGNIQDNIGVKCGITRPLLSAVAILCVGFSQLVLAWTDNTPIGVSLMAFGFGSTWCLIGPLTSDIVGQKAYGKIFSAVSMSAMLSTTIFNQVIAGPLYDAAYRAQPGNGNETKTCCGQQCYFSAHLSAAGVSFVVSLAPIVLYFRTKKFYSFFFAQNKHQDTKPTLYKSLIEEDSLLEN
eukprot:g1455.t1